MIEYLMDHSLALYLLFALPIAALGGLALGRAAATGRTDDEDRADHHENVNAARLREYAAGGWQDRHRQIAREVKDETCSD